MTNYIENVFHSLALVAIFAPLLGKRKSHLFSGHESLQDIAIPSCTVSSSSSSQYFYCSIFASLLANEKHVLKIFSMASHQFTCFFLLLLLLVPCVWFHETIENNKFEASALKTNRLHFKQIRASEQKEKLRMKFTMNERGKENYQRWRAKTQQKPFWISRK